MDFHKIGMDFFICSEFVKYTVDFLANFTNIIIVTMKLYKHWKEELISVSDSNKIGEDVFLVERIKREQFIVGPFRMDVSIAIILEAGSCGIMIDMKNYHACGPCMIIIMQNQIFQLTDASEDIDANVILMSNSFSENLLNQCSAFSNIRKTVKYSPVLGLAETTTFPFNMYFLLLKMLMKSQSKVFKLECAKHLTLAMFYGMANSLHNIHEIKQTDRKTALFLQFENELKAHYKEERNVAFYADKLCITPKYLSSIILEQTGRSALKFINEYTVTEGKALLLSTDMTILQVSEKLKFPSQSVFGKFFKRMTGYSPREYRNSILI
jgi:AraC family transcriptional activator of pobA